MNRALNQYRNIQATTSEPKALLFLLYDKTLQQMLLARQSLESGSDVHRQPLLKAQLGVLELDRTLNWKVLPDLAEALHGLYMHILIQLTAAFSKADVSALRRAEELLGELRGTWKEAVAQDSSMARAQAV